MKPVLGFLVLAVVAGALIGATRWLTADRIAANQAAREEAVIQEILGTNVSNPSNNLAADRLCRTEVRGYAGTIELLVLPSTANSDTIPTAHIEAVRVLQHRETPGIGDFITTNNSPWILGFAGLQIQKTPRDSSALWHDQIDAVSGATITRRAVIKGVAHACEHST